MGHLLDAVVAVEVGAPFRAELSRLWPNGLRQVKRRSIRDDLPHAATAA